MSDDPILSLPKAASYLGVSRGTLRALSEGTIPYYEIGSRRKFRRSDLDAYLAACRVEAPRIESRRARLVGRADGRPQRWT